MNGAHFFVALNTTAVTASPAHAQFLCGKAAEFRDTMKGDTVYRIWDQLHLCKLSKLVLVPKLQRHYALQSFLLYNEVSHVLVIGRQPQYSLAIPRTFL